MPSIGAGVVASIAGWIVDDLVQPFLGTGVSVLLSLLASAVVFFMIRKWLIDLRGR